MEGGVEGAGVNGSLEEGTLHLEAYSVVLSAASLLLALVCGGGGSLAVLAAISTAKTIQKYSYTVVLLLMVLCLVMAAVWAPLELLHLLYFHYYHANVTPHLKLTTVGLHLLLTTGLALLVIFLALENVLRFAGAFGKKLSRLWPLFSCVSTSGLSLSIFALYLLIAVDREGPFMDLYHVHNQHSFLFRLIDFSLLMLLVLVSMVTVIVCTVLKRRQEMREHKQHKNAIPQLLVREQQPAIDCNDEDDDLDDDPAPLPNIPRLSLTPDPTPSAGIGDLPSPSRNRNMLGVEMARILGRRRHTICQIGDSNLRMDPTARAKQYNYVRKFSVDVAALQAQLENPKISRKLPYQSDQELSKPKTDLGRPGLRGASPLGDSPLPLLPLHKPPPPLIKVSEDRDNEKDELKETEEEDEEEEEKKDETKKDETNKVAKEETEKKENEVDRAKEEEKTNDEEKTEAEKEAEKDKEEKNKKEEEEDVELDRDSPTCSVPEKRSLTFKDPPASDMDSETGGEAEEEDEEEDEESLQSYRANSELGDVSLSFVKLSCLLALTFLLGTLPVFLTEALREQMSRHAYSNTLACTTALSAIQVIVLPQVVICNDSVVSRAISRLWERIRRRAPCDRESAFNHDQVADHSSTSQV